MIKLKSKSKKNIEKDLVKKFRMLAEIKWPDGSLTKEFTFYSPMMFCEQNGGLSLTPVFFNIKTRVVKYFTSTIGFFTGMRDRKGNEIYDGDIVVFYNSDDKNYLNGIYETLGKVIFNESESQYLVELNDGRDIPLSEHLRAGGLMGNWVVYGNIHQNPQLFFK